jgi:2-polyprenyl-6-methoxyphenol hydroxylase-like FAD-dependent oxidoreductase
VGLATAILLARDGREVTVLEKDRQAAPASPAEAWELWHRPGVAQFRQAHQMHPKFRHLLDAELPTVRDEIRASGGKQWNLTQALPASLADRTGRPGDERFDTITARRPVLESSFARVAEDTPGVKIVRGESVIGVVTGPSVCHGVPHVTGVRTASGAEIPTDLVIDAMGRRSRFGEWVTSIGGRPPYEESSDTASRTTPATTARPTGRYPSFGA